MGYPVKSHGDIYIYIHKANALDYPLELYSKMPLLKIPYIITWRNQDSADLEVSSLFLPFKERV